MDCDPNKHNVRPTINLFVFTVSSHFFQTWVGREKKLFSAKNFPIFGCCTAILTINKPLFYMYKGFLRKIQLHFTGN